MPFGRHTPSSHITPSSRHTSRFRRTSPRNTIVVACTLALACETATAPIAQAAALHPATAVSLYQQGLKLKQTNPEQAIRDFEQATTLDPTWEAPVYEAGALLAVSHFNSAVPVLLHAATLNPADDTVWNILGWGYYQHQNYAQAEQSFLKQLQVSPSSPYARWGLANCYANSQVRAFHSARSYLTQLLANAQLHNQALRLLTNLPPDAVDATYQPSHPVSFEDAIAMTLSYRSDVSSTTAQNNGQPVTDGSGHAPDSAVAAYVAWASGHHLLAGLTIPSFRAPATRLFAAVFFSRFYGLDRFEYVRPFPLVDMGTVSVDNQMYVNSILANRLMSETASGQFEPNGSMTRSSFNRLVAHANTAMRHPPAPASWSTPPVLSLPGKPFLYFFQTSRPDAATQQQDMLSHAKDISAIGLTLYPFAADVRADLAARRTAIDRTSYLLTPTSGGPDQQQELANVKQDGLQPFMVVGNYNQTTNQSDPAIVHQLLSNPATIAKLTTEAVGLASSEHLAGITVDFENVRTEDRSNYVTFMSTLHRSALKAGLTTMVCLPEEDGASGITAYDYSGLADAADLVMLITYDEHTPGSRPGPIHEAFNDDRVVKYALQQIPANKLLIGAADYGYDWSGGSGVEVSQQEAKSLALRFKAPVTMDSTSMTPTFNYTDDKGVKHTVWYEDNQSLSTVFQLVKTYGLRGVAVWHLGADNTSFWDAWHQTFSNGNTSG